MDDTSRRITGLMTILRGLLAEKAHDQDDPWARVVFQCDRGPGGQEKDGSSMELKAPEAGETDDVIRERLKKALAEYRGLHDSPPHKIDIEKACRLSVTYEAAEAERPLLNKVALVTGAAGAIGSGICKALLEKGCRVAATDCNEVALGNVVDELKEGAVGRIAGIMLDVTDAESVGSGFDEAVCRWGGVDIVIVNAGAAQVCSLMDLKLEDFQRLERINIEGTLLTIAEAGRCMRRQGTGGDIVLISTKNVFMPGAEFGAYSATKAGAHQLARIASQELAGFDVRVNMVAPDAVFSEGAHKSGLWAEVGPSRMRARGLTEDGLEEYYRNRNLLKTRVEARHVANAVLFFVTRQTPTTGATIPVDGGLPDSTPR
ncbi:MAG: SDR family NAD(P)-dependent oxidoreductase [Lentisphaerales bacterium]|nr:MAG: SDR family NAD(P)-dependent oxidoreductase [Lentisphaerales bacterium]